MVTQKDLSTDSAANATRALILRDSLNFLGLTLVTIALFAVTLFLFRSFAAHRADLARQSSEEGARDLQSGKPEDAIAALRTALSYAPDTRSYQLLLAQALGDAGHTEESYEYYMGLWGAEPGSGIINLQLARLAAKRKDRQPAVNFYRAAIYGTWEGDGVARRAETRLELARYLIAIHDPAPARMELLIAGGNMPGSPDFDLTLGELLEQSDDAADASSYYRKALAARPDDPTALKAAGRLAFRLGDFAAAHRLFARDMAQRAKDRAAELDPSDLKISEAAARILELIPARDLPTRERVSRILAARALAGRRLDACSAQLAAAGKLPAPLQSLDSRWAAPESTLNAAALARDPAQQDATMQLVYDTESEAEKSCSPAVGDDALLLKLGGRASASPLPQDMEAVR